MAPEDERKPRVYKKLSAERAFHREEEDADSIEHPSEDVQKLRRKRAREDADAPAFSA